jgi:hypothetical protein
LQEPRVTEKSAAGGRSSKHESGCMVRQQHVECRNKTLKIKRFQRLVDETMQGFAFMQGILEDFDI